MYVYMCCFVKIYNKVDKNLCIFQKRFRMFVICALALNSKKVKCRFVIAFIFFIRWKFNPC